MNVQPRTLFDKIWESHVVHRQEGYPDVLYIDAHLIHEVTSPQAFDGLRRRGIAVARPERTWATMDHNVPTNQRDNPIREIMSRRQLETLEKNCKEFGIRLYDLSHPFQGIVHVIGPELGITKPGMTIVCGDSHTSTHGAFGVIAFGIGTSEVEQVLATQTMLQYKPKLMSIWIDGELGKGVSAKDIILYIIAKISVSGATGYFVEYRGSAIEKLTIEARMTICNMSIEISVISTTNKAFQQIKQEAENESLSRLSPQDIPFKETIIDKERAFIFPAYEHLLGSVTVAHKGYIYNISRWYSEKDVPEELFNQSLSTFKFLNQTPN